MKRFIAKIGASNLVSQQLFQKVGFEECGKCPIFQEVHFEKIVEGQFELEINSLADKMVFGLYDENG